MDRARRLDNAKFPGNLIFSNENDICRLKIENCKDVSWSKVREAAHPYLKVTFLGCQGRPTSLDSFWMSSGAVQMFQTSCHIFVTFQTGSKILMLTQFYPNKIELYWELLRITEIYWDLAFVHPSEQRYLSLSSQKWSETVSGRFSSIFSALESSPPDRKRWMQLVREICDFIAWGPSIREVKGSTKHPHESNIFQFFLDISRFF